MNALAGIKAYAKVEVESGVSSADPHKLIAMLYQGAILSIANARNSILRKDISAKGAAISKAITIIDDGLYACLDKKVGGELALNLASLYEYMVMRLLAANLNNDLTILDEVARLLGELQGAWEGIRPAAQAAKSPEIVPAPTADKVENSNTTTPQSSIGKKASLMYGRM
jgi:flagellar secretion chaperone FliS